MFKINKPLTLVFNLVIYTEKKPDFCHLFNVDRK